MAEKWLEVKGSALTTFNKEGDEIIAKFISKEEGKGKYENTFYNFSNLKTKEIKGFFGSAVIDRLFTTAENEGFLKKDCIFRLVYVGKVKTQAGRKVKNFKLYFAR